MIDTPTLQSIQPYAIVATFLTLYIAEHIFPQRRELIDYPHDVRNILVGAFNFAIVIGVSSFFLRFLMWITGEHCGLFNWLNVQGWPRYIIEFVALDLTMYWWHRFNHRMKFLWRFHKFHHVDTKLNSTTAIRFHTVELLFSYVMRLGVFAVLGIGLPGFLLYNIIFTIVVIFQHSAIRINMQIDAALRNIIVTPHMHRIHHSIIRDETDSNFSSVFRSWDVIFRTYREQPKAGIEFGLPRENK
jgi:sterol desaturase/sphingolipid hydroxylase (fatty acid hydroxylase superfamily)